MRESLIPALFAGDPPAELGPRPRPGVLSEAEALAQSTAALGPLVKEGPAAACLRALVLLWNDHLDAAHALVQDLSGPDAAYVHGIMHRREPDFSNARYWFHRAGDHPALEPLADAAAPVLAAHAALPFRLIRDGRWDPFAFIDAVSAASRGGAVSSEVGFLRELQRLESRCLALHLAGA